MEDLLAGPDRTQACIAHRTRRRTMLGSVWGIAGSSPRARGRLFDLQALHGPKTRASPCGCRPPSRHFRAKCSARFLAQICRGRAASSVRAARGRARNQAFVNGRLRACQCHARHCLRGCQRMGRHQDRSAWAWIGWAGYGSGKGRFRIEGQARPYRGHAHGHAAAMLPVPPAARGQTCILAAVNEG